MWKNDLAQFALLHRRRSSPLVNYPLSSFLLPRNSTQGIAQSWATVFLRECRMRVGENIWNMEERGVCTVNQRKIYNESSRQKQSIPITAYSPRVSIVIPLCVFGIIRVHCNQWVFTIISRQRPFVTNYSPFILSTIFSSFRVERNVSIRSSVFGNRQVTIEKRKILPR